MLGALTSPQHFVLFFILIEYYGGIYIMYLLSVLEILCGKYFPQNFFQKFSYKMKKIWFLRTHEKSQISET